MGFAVTHQGGTKDVEFEAYARLLRQKGVSIEFEPPMGGAMIGLYAEFDGSQSVWRFSKLMALDRDPL